MIYTNIKNIIKNIIIRYNIRAHEMDTDLQKFVKCDVFTPDEISKLMASKLNNKGTLFLIVFKLCSIL